MSSALASISIWYRVQDRGFREAIGVPKFTDHILLLVFPSMLDVPAHTTLATCSASASRQLCRSTNRYSYPYRITNQLDWSWEHVINGFPLVKKGEAGRSLTFNLSIFSRITKSVFSDWIARRRAVLSLLGCTFMM